MVNFADSHAEDAVLGIVRDRVKKFRVKSKSVDDSRIELIIEVRVAEQQLSFINELNRIESVNRAMLVSSGEYIS